MTTGRKIKSFVKETMALIAGDDSKALAEKNLRKADQAFLTHIHSEEGKTVDLEDKVDECKARLSKSRLNNGKPIENRTTYINNVMSARKDLLSAEKELKDHLYNLGVLKEEHKALELEVDEVDAA